MRFLLPLLALFCRFSLAQENPDALFKKLNAARHDTDRALIYVDLAQYYTDNNVTKAHQYGHQALALALKTKNKTAIYASYTALGGAVPLVGKNDSALYYYQLSLKLARELKSEHKEARALNNIGNYYASFNDNVNGLNYYLQAARLAEKLNLKEGMANVYNNIGVIYFSQKNIDEAIHYYFKTVKIGEEIKNDHLIAMGLSNLGDALDEKGRADTALIVYNSGIEHAKKVGNIYGLANMYGALASAYRALKKYDKAIMSYNLSDQYSLQSNDYATLAYNCNSKAILYEQMKDYKRALLLYKQGEDIALRYQIPDILKVIYKNTSDLLYELGKYKEGLEYSQKFITLNDSIYTVEASKQLAEMEAKYETDKKEKEIKLLNQEQELKNNEIEKHRSFRNFLLIVVGFTLIAVIAIFRSYRTKKKANQLLEVKNKVIEQQKETVEEKNKEILDSINYAKSLQDAILPPGKFVDAVFKESFILYMPKDIVAGDFYWVEKSSGLVLFAAADCTGHGVPGAMVSVVCSNALNRTVKEFGITEPGKILDKVRELVIETFQRSEREVKDGMDISLGSLNLKTGELKWAGANNPLWYASNSEIKEIVADKQPVGKYAEEKPFTTHTVALPENTCVYLFTDGYADQFGGPKGKKLKYKQFSQILLENTTRPLKEQHDILKTHFDIWKGDLEQVDDVCIIGIRI